ncbi:MAG: hypothetical protein KUG69_13980 [Marinosulfonomonas sp.]|nr:hypothetical protein [Marinosulfonomonas sp.]
MKAWQRGWHIDGAVFGSRKRGPALLAQGTKSPVEALLVMGGCEACGHFGGKYTTSSSRIGNNPRILRGMLLQSACFGNSFWVFATTRVKSSMRKNGRVVMDISSDWVILAAVVLLLALVVVLFFSTDSDSAKQQRSSFDDTKPRRNDAPMQTTASNK